MIWHKMQHILECLVFYTLLVVCWTAEAKTNVLGGKLNSADNLQDCKSACINNAGCEGVDWNPTHHARQKCWLSGPWSGGKNFGSAPHQITHYGLIRNCAGKP